MGTMLWCEIDGEKLRRLRERRLWLIRELAEKSGVIATLSATHRAWQKRAHTRTPSASSLKPSM